MASVIHVFVTFLVVYSIYAKANDVSSFLNDIDKKLCKDLSNNANVYFNDVITSNNIKCVQDGLRYDELRPLYDVRFNERPTFIFECFTYNDVKIVFDYAFKNDIKFRIRSGGHNSAGYSICNNCFSIDVRRLRIVQIDQTVPSARFGVGWNVKQLALRLETDTSTKYWLPFGLNNVGVGGHIQGGGWGLGIKQFGLVTDSLLEVKILIVDDKEKGNGKGKGKSKGQSVSKIVTASLTENPDLFYCIRGVVAPSCGIVLEYTAKIYPQEGFNFGRRSNNYVLPPPAILQQFGINENDLIKGIVNEIVLPELIEEDYLSIVSLFRAPIAVGSSMAIRMTRIYSNYTSIDDIEASYAELDALLATKYLATKLDISISFFGSYTETVCTNDYTSGAATFDDSIPITGDINQCRDPAFLEVSTTNASLDGRTWMYDSFEEFATLLLDTEFGMDYIIQRTFDPICDTALSCGFFFTSWGGKLNNPQVINKTAFPHRNSIFDFNILTRRSNPLIPNPDQWVSDVFTRINNNNLTTRRVYANYIAEELTESEYLEYYYGNNLNTLINSKCKFDPCNVFTNQQGLPTDSCICDSTQNNNNNNNGAQTQETKHSNNIVIANNVRHYNVLYILYLVILIVFLS
mmetsp:Transcript_43146/g.53008  ORF Transcript_43146/g.53008 Transcript_43146/m.53008 type:complete len:633 (-) Transcript_43146:53-1951(-)